MAKPVPTIQPDNVLLELLKGWREWQAALTQAKEVEMRYRLEIAKRLFPSPDEGTNNLLLAGAGKMTLKHSLTRKVDEGVLCALTPAFRAAGIPVDTLIRRKPELAVSVYRLLTPEQLVQFDPCIVTAPGSPQLEFKPVPE